MSTLLIFILVLFSVLFFIIQKKRKNNFLYEKSIHEQLLLLVKRFPISLIFLLAITLYAFLSINNNITISYRLYLFLSISLLTNIVVILLLEDFFNYLKTNLISIIPIIILVFYSYSLPQNTGLLYTAKITEIAAIYISLFLSIFFINFLKKNRDKEFWNFTLKTINQVILACFLGAIIFAGLALALFSVDSLFNVLIDKTEFENLAVICFFIITIYFLINIPDKESKFDKNIFYPKIQKTFILYIFTPILVIYTVILYMYLLRIVVTWELPNGWVSWLVSVLAFGGLLVATLLYPIQEEEKNKQINYFFRLFCLLIFPLLALMTIGIFRRINDYGITINRAYILILNFWFYGIYIYLFFTKLKHVKWIIISFSVVVLLSSINIFGVACITKKSLTKEINLVFEKQVSYEEASDILSEKNYDEKKRIQNILNYLYDNLGKESVQIFFTDKVSDYSWEWIETLDVVYDDNNYSKFINYNFQNGNKFFKIDNYDNFIDVQYFYYQAEDTIVKYYFDSEKIKILIGNKTFIIPVKELFIINEDYRDKEIVIKEENYQIIINNLYGNYYEDYYDATDTIIISEFNAFLFYND